MDLARRETIMIADIPPPSDLRRHHPIFRTSAYIVWIVASALVCSLALIYPLDDSQFQESAGSKVSQASINLNVQLDRQSCRKPRVHQISPSGLAKYIIKDMPISTNETSPFNMDVA